MDQRDREVLGYLQSEVPLVSTPFAVVGQQIDMSEKEVIKRATRLKKEGVIRQITATFDGRSLGYQSCLVAVRVPETHLDQAAAIIGAHPGVSQNYRRNHDFNLWFTIAVPPSSRIGLDRTVAILAEEAECEAARQFPTLRLLKNGSSEGGDPAAEPHSEGSDTKPAPLTDGEIAVVRALEGDFPLQPRPFDLLARIAELDADAFLEAARTLARRQQLRRLSAITESRKAFSASAMGVWRIPEDRLDEFAAALAPQKAVSHGYLRPTYEDWPFNVFTTVHGRSVDECDSVLRAIARDFGVTEMESLFPTKEYKRTRIAYFSPEFAAWESRHLGSAEASAAS